MTVTTFGSLEKPREAATSAIFTVVSNNYLHFARTLLMSAREFHPEADLFCVIVDSDLSHADVLSSEFKVIRLDELDLPGGETFYFRYNVLELNTAVKPWAMAHLLERGYEKVIYIDPDIRLYRALDEVVERLDTESDIVVTPHLLSPIKDDLSPTELDIRRAGTYNFGFCAVRNTSNTMRFLKWWQSKLEYGCVVALDKGIFVDQSWIDLVPGLFDNVYVLRHPGYNVAYWNLAQRDVQVHRNAWTVNDQPLVFFHYSGLNPINPEPFSKHQNRFTLETLGPSKQLVKAYVRELLANGAKKYSEIPYGFGRFEDGEKIPMFFAETYRDTPSLQRVLGEKPYARSSILLETGRVVESENLSWAMLALWSARADLQTAFPLTSADGVRGYRGWFIHDGSNYYSERVIKHHRDIVLGADLDVPSNRDSAPMSVAAASQEEVRRDDINRVRGVFYAILGRFPEQEALTTYCQILAKPNGRFKVWKAIAMSRENRMRPGWRSRAYTGLRVAWAHDLSAHYDWLSSPSEEPAAVMPTPDSIMVEDVPTIDAGATAEAEPIAAFTPAWYAKRVDALRHQVAPFWLHQAEPDSKSAGYWTTATIKLQLPDGIVGRSARLEGSYNGDLIARQSGTPEAQVAIFLRDQLLHVGELSKNADFVFDFELPAELGARPNLVILTEKYFIPAEIGLGADGRELAIKLKTVRVGDEVVFDCQNDTPVRFNGRDGVQAPGINLVGYIKAELGVGEAARSLAAAAKCADIPYSLIDVGFQSSNRQNDLSALSNAVADKQPIDIVYVNADQTPTTLSHLRKLGHAADLRIGVWHWEQATLPDRFIGSFSGLDEVWVPTVFVQEAVSGISTIPVVKIPDAINFAIPSAPRRARFGLPSRGFCALMMYDLDSYQYRKNPEAAIAAFRLATKGKRTATLVIKTINSKNHQAEFAALKRAVSDIPNVVFIDEFLTRAEVYELQACCDVLLSLHRAEGFGLAPAEMMFIGKPVIATGWSGNMDFMTPMNSYPVEYELKALPTSHGPYEAGQLWAEADIEHAAACLRDIIQRPDEAAKKGQRAAADIRAKLSPEVVGRQMRDRLNLLANQYGIS